MIEQTRAISRKDRGSALCQEGANGSRSYCGFLALASELREQDPLSAIPGFLLVSGIPVSLLLLQVMTLNLDRGKIG